MLVTTDGANPYAEQITYDSEWIENTPTGISWLNLLTSQSIPEENDRIDSSPKPVRHHSDSNCSSSSIESCYVVLEIQRPRSINEIPSKVDEDEEEVVEKTVKEEDEEEEEEEEVEEIEELHFAQMNNDAHNVECEQLAVSMTTEVNSIKFFSLKSQIRKIKQSLLSRYL